MSYDGGGRPMADPNNLFTETAGAASFAFREYFRPLVFAARILRLTVAPSESPASDEPSLTCAKAILRERLARGRHHEKVLLVLAVGSALASLLAVAISLLPALNVELAAF